MAVWLSAGICAIPVVFLTHEAGHFAADIAFGFPRPCLHYASTTHALEVRFWAAYNKGGLELAAGVLPPWKVGASAAAGPLITYLTALLCCWHAKQSPAAPVVSVGTAAPVRILPILVAAAAGRHRSDEAEVAAITGLPEAALIGFGVAVMVGSAVWLMRRLPAVDRASAITSMWAGMLAGLWIYWFVGSRLLP